jgi:uncharacterized membrane protein (DUF4010 family)
MQFVLVALVILPLLPDRTYGPYDVLNPHRIWFFVVLIIGLSVFGYILSKFLGERAGILLAGILGGLVSSTATTVSQARRTRSDPACAPAAVTIVVLASSVMYARILLLIGIAAPSFFVAAWLPITILMLVNLLLAAAAWGMTRRHARPAAETGTPSELRAALVFGLLYAVVLFIVAAVRDRYGASALYVLAGVSGLTDVDAITLSMSQLAQQSRLVPDTGWRLVILATLSNLLFKAVAAGLGGDPRFRRPLWACFAVILAAGAGLMLLWPHDGLVTSAP